MSRRDFIFRRVHKENLGSFYLSLNLKTFKINNFMHIGIILDGNRRYARKLALKPWEGHREGAKTIEKLIEWVEELNIDELTLYTLSVENLQRDKDELNYLFDIIYDRLNKFKTDKRIYDKQVRICFIGDLKLIPKRIQNVCAELEQLTKTHKRYKINFCLAYSGRQEIIQAIKKIDDQKNITEEELTKNLQLSSEPEFIIRTGGHTRSSNFLPWQSVYSEWFYTDKLWPEFTKADLENALEKYKTIKRNFGR